MTLNFKSSLYSSIILHLLLCVILSIITNNSGIKKPFVVFGAHSKKNYHTLYKGGHLKKAHYSSTPFISDKKKSDTGLRHGSKTGRGKIKTKHVPKSQKPSKIIKPKSFNSNRKAAKHTNSKSKIIQKGDRPIFSEDSEKKKLSAVKIKQKKARELASKKELEKTKKDQQKRRALLDKKIKKEREQKETLKKVEALALQAAQEAKKVEDLPEPPVSPDKILTQNSPQNEPDILNEENPSEDNSGFDIDQTTSTLVLNFGSNVNTDPEISIYQKYVQKEVERLWKPPLGVPRGTTCRIGFLIDRKGKVQNFEIIKRSNVLIYDLSILRVAHIFKFNKKLWGKSFNIDFCQ